MSVPQSSRIKKKTLAVPVTLTFRTPNCRKIITSVSTGGFTPKESENESDNHIERPKKRKIRRTDHSFHIPQEFESPMPLSEVSDTNKSNRKIRRHLDVLGQPELETSTEEVTKSQKRKTIKRSTKKVNYFEETELIPSFSTSSKNYDSVNTQNGTDIKKPKKSSLKKTKTLNNSDLSDELKVGALRMSTRKTKNSRKCLRISNTPVKAEDKENISMGEIQNNSTLSHDEINIKKSRLSNSPDPNISNVLDYSRSNKRKSIPKILTTEPVQNEAGSDSLGKKINTGNFLEYTDNSSNYDTPSENRESKSSYVTISSASENNDENPNSIISGEVDFNTFLETKSVNRKSGKASRRSTIVRAEIKNDKTREHMNKRKTIASHPHALLEEKTSFPPLKSRKSMRKRWSDDLKNDPNGVENRFDFLKSLENNTKGESLNAETRSSGERSSSTVEKSIPTTSETEIQSLPEYESDIFGDTSEKDNNSKIRRSKSNSKRRSKSLLSNSSSRYLKNLSNSLNMDVDENCAPEKRRTSRRSSRMSTKTTEIEQNNMDDEEGAKDTIDMVTSDEGVETLQVSSSKNKRHSRSSGNLSRSIQKNADITMNEEEVTDCVETFKDKRQSNSSDLCTENEGTSKKKRNSTFERRKSMRFSKLANDTPNNQPWIESENSSFERKKSIRCSKLSNDSPNQEPWIESENGTSDDCIIIDDTLNVTIEKDKSIQTLPSESLRHSKGKRRSRSLTSVAYTPENWGRIDETNGDSSFESNNSMKRISVRYHGTPHPMHKRRRTYELEESVTDPSVLQALSESSSSQATVETQPSCSKKVRFEHVTMRRAQAAKKTNNNSKTIQPATASPKTTPQTSGNVKQSQSFIQKFIPSTSSTPYVPLKFNLAKEVLTRNAKTSSQHVKRRSRSAEECGSRPNRTKMPDFAKLHKKAADKMESLVEMKERKAERARILLSGQRPAPTQDTSSHETVKKSHRQLMFDKPSVSSVVVKEKPRIMTNKQTNATGGRSRNTPKKQDKVEPSKTSRFGFKVTTATSTDKKAEIKAITNKTKPAKDTRAENRTVLKGVRGNRRFDLLMKMRQK